jgi:transposase
VDHETRIRDLEAQLRARDARIAELEAQSAAKDRRIAELEQQVATLLDKVEFLTEKLNQNSRNSNKPPSTDGPKAQSKGGDDKRGAAGPKGSRRGKDKQRDKRNGKDKRKRGGQPGHRGATRRLIPEDQVDKFVDLYPDECENCWRSLADVQKPDSAAKRYQQTEIPPVKPTVTETRRHGVTCPCCNHKTYAAYDPQKIPQSPFGPRLAAIVTLLTGIYHVSRRQTVGLMKDLMGVDISLGAVSAIEGRFAELLQPVYEEVSDKVEKAKVKHTDGTTWRESGAYRSLWTIATSAATLFKIILSGSASVLKPLFGELRGILVSDRDSALNFWAMDQRQICWSHLVRKFVSFFERDGPASVLGAELLDYSGLIFEYWHAYKDGKIDRKRLAELFAPVREQVEATLERAVAADIPRLSGSCKNILAHRQALWTFVDQEGVEPTNNHGEQELRGFVMWRKRCFGSQSERGNCFAERMMTVARTAVKQNKNPLAFLTECARAQDAGRAMPSLFEPDSHPLPA